MDEHDHLALEQIAALVDDPSAASGREHLETCARCSAEYAALSRIRGTLSAMPGLSPPAHEWSRLETRAFGGRPRRGRGWARAWKAAWPRASSIAAGAVILLGSGILIGVRLERQRALAPAARALVALSRLDSLRRTSAPDSSAPKAESSTAVRNLATLKALGDASREALGYAPTDPLVNSYFDQVSRDQVDLESRFGARAARDSIATHARYDSVRRRARTYFRELTDRPRSLLDQPLREESFMLGAQLVPVDSTLGAKLGGRSTGLLVVRLLQDTPASKLGLQQGDIVIAADGQPVDEVGELRSAIEKAFASEHEIKLTWLRGSAQRSALLSPPTGPP